MQGYYLYEIRSEDTVASVVQKLQNTLETLVFIRISTGPLLFSNEDNLRLLAHYAREENKTLVLLTKDKRLQELADKYRINTSDSIEAFFKEPSEATKIYSRARKSSKSKLPMWVRTTLIAAFVVFSLLVGLQWGLRYWLLPKVTITVYPNLIRENKEITLSLQDMNPELESQEVKMVATVPTTGSKMVGTERAKGEVIFFNQNTKQLKLAKGTEIKTKKGRVYLLKEDVLVPGAEVVYVLDIRSSQTAGQALGYIEAKELGAEYNVIAGEISLLAGNYKDITVRNTKPVSGGKSEKRPVVTLADREAAKKAAIELLSTEEIKLHPYEFPVVGSETKSDVEVEFDVEEGAFAPTVRATATQTISLKKIAKEELLRQAQVVLPEYLPQNLLIKPDTANILTASIDESLAKVVVAMDLYYSIKPEEVASNIAGLKISEATELIADQAVMAVEGLKGDTLPKRKEWIKVVVSSDFKSSTNKGVLSSNQKTTGL